MSQGKYVLTRFLRGSFCMLAVHAALRHEAAAQGSKADYTRATTFAQRTEDKVFRAKVDPAWLPGDTSFWYRVRTAPAVDGFVTIHQHPEPAPLRTVRTRALAPRLLRSGPSLPPAPPMAWQIAQPFLR